MRKTKKLLSILLTLCMLLSVVPMMTFTAGAVSDGWELVTFKNGDSTVCNSTCEYQIDTDGTMTIRPIPGKSGELPVDSSEEYGYKQITWCWDIGFTDNENIVKKVIFEDGVKAGNTLYYMFYGFTSLESVDFSGLDTTNTKNMAWLLDYCTGLKSITFGDKFDTSNVTTMQNMFGACEALETLDLSKFDTSKVTDMSYMFGDCKVLTGLDLKNFNTSSVKDMSGMFSWCLGLTELNLSEFDTSSVENMSGMFSDCSGLTELDLSGFNTANVSDMSWMFYNCSALKTIYVGDAWTAEQLDSSNWQDSDMFADCNSIVGGNGTVFDGSKTDKEYACIDTAGNKGYLTKVSALTVTFNSMGGTAIEEQKVEPNAKATKPTDPTRSNSTFIGWYLNGIEFDFENTTITGNITLTAKWETTNTNNETITVGTGKEIEVLAKTKDDKPLEIKVTGLDEVAEEIKSVSTISDLDKVKAKLIVNELADTSTDGQTAIKTKANADNERTTENSKSFYFLDTHIESYIKKTTENDFKFNENLDEVTTVQEIELPFDTTGKINIEYYRVHNGAEAFKNNKTGEDGTFYVEGTGAAAVMHIFANKFCDSAVVYDNVPTQIADAKYSASLTLYNDISINIRISGLGNGFDKSKLEVTADGTEISRDNIIYDKNTNVCYVKYTGIESDEMTESVNFVVNYNGVNNITSFNYSVKTYCDTILNNSKYSSEAYAKLRTLCKAVLEYGAESQKYSGVTDETKLATYGIENLTDFSEFSFSDEFANADHEGVRRGIWQGISLDGANLTIGSNIAINIAFKNSDDMSGYTFDSNGTDVSVGDGITSSGSGEDTVYTISYGEFGAADFDKEIPVMRGGTSLSHFSYSYSVNDYCYAVITSTDDKYDDVKDLCKAIYNYGVAAKAYVGG